MVWEIHVWLLLLLYRKTRSEVPIVIQQWNYLHPWQVTRCVVGAHCSEQIAGNVYASLHTAPLIQKCYRDTYILKDFDEARLPVQLARRRGQIWRASRVVRESVCQCQSLNCPGLDGSMLLYSVK
jgi:hypothetical protein